MYEKMCRLDVYTTPLYIKRLEHPWILASVGVLGPIPQPYQVPLSAKCIGFVSCKKTEDQRG